MISTGVELKTFINSLNAEDDIDDTLLDVLVDNAKTILEEERPWTVLKKTDTSKTVTLANTWQTAIDLSTISDFSRLDVYSSNPAVKIFDGNNRYEYYLLKPFDQRLEYKDVSYTCIYDENAKILYLNGVLPFAGTLWVNYLSTSPEIDLESDSTVWDRFPSRFLPILGYYAAGIFKGAVDYDTINKQMLPTNQNTLQLIKNAMEKWDNEKQLAVTQGNDPTDYPGGYPRAGAINRHNTY